MLLAIVQFVLLLLVLVLVLLVVLIHGTSTSTNTGLHMDTNATHYSILLRHGGCGGYQHQY